ncbi:hypothetical protein [Methylobacterium nigriterrae]|uniref:hypothetical protein n=1 Tax=Methylobacterium nigriterrae TaxID=3127512 RepID=UPI0030135062
MPLTVIPGVTADGKPFDPFADLVRNLVQLLKASGEEIVGIGRSESEAWVDWRPARSPDALPMRSSFVRDPFLRRELEDIAAAEETEIPILLDGQALAALVTREEAKAEGVVFLDERRRCGS